MFLLLGNIDQNQYVDKVRIIFDFIAPRILNEDIETIWKMQVENPPNLPKINRSFYP